MDNQDAPLRLVSSAVAALTLGVDIATLQRWNILGRGPAAVRGLDCAALAYRRRDLEAWQDRVGAAPRASVMA